MPPLKFGGEEDMFVIVTYDVDKKRCARVMKYLRQWLGHRQRSVFSGFLTDTQVRVMQHGLRNLVDPEYDSVIVFKTNRADQIEEWNTRRAADVHKTGRVADHPARREHKRRKREPISGQQRSLRLRF